MDQLINKVAQFITKQSLFHPGAGIIIGLSGGPDSVFLTYALKTLQKEYAFTLVAAHLDHGWREKSREDLIFCQALCNQLAIPLVSKRLTADDYATLPARCGGSREEQGRMLRRRFFEEVRIAQKATHIALGHHADDQIETFFIRLIRGAGITGLTGIKPRDKHSVHPLLCCNKKEILAALATQNIPFLHDPTNETDLFLRNKIRHHVIPALHGCDNRFNRSLLKTMAHLHETDAFINETVNTVFENLSLIHEEKRQLDLRGLRAQSPFMQKRIIVTWLISEKLPFVPSQALFNEIIRFLNHNKSSRHLLYDTFYIVKSKGYARLEKKV